MWAAETLAIGNDYYTCKPSPCPPLMHSNPFIPTPKRKFALDFCTTQLSFMSVPGPALLCIHPFIFCCRPSNCSFFGLAVRPRYRIASSQSCLGGGASRLLQLPISSHRFIISTVHQPVRIPLHPSPLAWQTAIATLQDRLAWHRLIASCFPR